MRDALLCTVALLVLCSPAPGAPPGHAAATAAGERLLEKLPPDVLTGIPSAVREDVRSGRIPAADMARPFGMLLYPLDARAASLPVYEMGFVPEWISHGTTIPAAIDEDPLSEDSIDGLCSVAPLTGASDAPTVYPYYWVGNVGSMGTSYYQAPTDSSTCTVDNTDLTRYFYAWINSPRTQDVTALMGSSDYFKLWINGALVLRRTSGGPKPFTVDEYSGDVRLMEGWNLLVVRQTFPQLGPANDPSDDNKYKYFSLRFVTRTPDHTPVTDWAESIDPLCADLANFHGTYSHVWVLNMPGITGSGGSRWRADMYLFNGMPSRWMYDVRYFREGNNSGSPDVEKTLELEPFETVVSKDALLNLLGVSANEKGYLEISGAYYYQLTGSGWLYVKVFNQGGTGTYGMHVPARYAYDYEYSAAFFGLRSGRYRCNFGWVPMINDGSDIDITLRLWAPGWAAPVEKSFTHLEGYFQIDDVFAKLGVADRVTDGAILQYFVDRNATNHQGFPYVTVNDGNPGQGMSGSSDPLFLLPGGFYYLPPM